MFAVCFNSLRNLVTSSVVYTFIYNSKTGFKNIYKTVQ
jgi:hypothetical protein